MAISVTFISALFLISILENNISWKVSDKINAKLACEILQVAINTIRQTDNNYFSL